MEGFQLITDARYTQFTRCCTAADALPGSSLMQVMEPQALASSPPERAENSGFVRPEGNRKIEILLPAAQERPRSAARALTQLVSS